MQQKTQQATLFISNFKTYKMNLLIKKILILISPLILWGLVVLLIDPYNYFSISLINDDAKESAKKLNTLMYRTIDYMHYPCENMLIGDSRTNALPIDLVEDLTDKNWKKLNTNAAKLNEIFELFYMANERKPIKNIIIGINFNMFNEYSYADRVSGIKKILDNPLMYLYNKDVAQSTFITIRQLLTNKQFSSTPSMSKEEFWNWNISTKTRHWYERYKFPNNLYQQLIDFDDYTSKNGINVIFIIVPHHNEFRNRLYEFGLKEEELTFKKVMVSLKAKVYDYDYNNDITSVKSNFSDPVHYNHDIGELMIKEIFLDDLKIGKTSHNIRCTPKE